MRKKLILEYGQGKREPKVRVLWVRTPVDIPRGRPLRVLIYARFSTDEQRKRTIKAQIEYCRRFLKALGINHAEISILTDEKLSGQLRSRPGIDQVWVGINQRAWDLILVEDCGRLYRDEIACVELVRLAVDNGIRTICVQDMIDTAAPDWEERLKDAARHHAAFARYCSPKIKRAHEELWEIGAAIGLLKPGYLREPMVAAQIGDDEPPKCDKVDPHWAPTIKETYERIAAGESPWSVACWLTQVGLPKAANAHSRVWTDWNVRDLIRRPDYRGFQVFRDLISKKMYSTGKHKPTTNSRDEVLSREMPHLRIVEDWLWHAANAAIDDRAPEADTPRGTANPNYGVPRDSRGPLSGTFLCRCGAKMQVDGRGEGGYRCSRVRSGRCWNKATALRDKTHHWLSQAITQQLQLLDGRLDDLLAHASEFLNDAGRRAERKAQLEKKQAKLKKTGKRLGRAIAFGKKTSDTLVAMLEKCEDGLARVAAKLERLKSRETLCAPPTREEIEERIRIVIEALERMDRTSRDEIRQLVGKIVAIPYQQFDNNNVVLRARFTLRLAVLLPARTRAALKGLCEGPAANQFDSIPMLVDLFEPSTGPKHGLAALKLAEEGLGLTAIGRTLGITKRKANIAVQYGRQLRVAGLTDPFIELTEPPAAASRWRTHPAHEPRQDDNAQQA